jgi:uncharacterized protein
MSEPESLLEFPCEFPIKIMGRSEPAFADAVVKVVLRHAPDFDPATTEMRASSHGNYIGLTCVIRAESRCQLDALYTELSRHPLVKVVL